jgi:chromosomal replication initiator protein
MGDETIVVATGTDFAQKTLNSKYLDVIKESCIKNGIFVENVEIVVDPTLLDKPKSEKINVKKISDPTFKKDKEFKAQIKNLTLNPKYTFDTYIIGDNNHIASAIGMAISKKPGVAHNPLFLYGNVGVGKTHLLQSIGNAMVKLDPTKNALYCSAETYVNEFVEAIRNNRTNKFKDKYRKVDLLIIDDVQFMGKTPKSQEELFHTFNQLIESNKQVILSSDRPPRELPDITDRLRSRFESGMLTDIGAPDFETRLAILRKKCQEQQALISDGILDYIATNVAENVRELEGVLHQIITLFEYKRDMTIEDVQKHLSKHKYFPETPISNKTTNKNTVINFVAEHFNITPNDINGISRQREIVLPRQIAMYILKEDLNMSLEAIGKHMGGKNHTTVLHSIKKITKELQTDKSLLSNINSIKRSLGLI